MTCSKVRDTVEKERAASGFKESGQRLDLSRIGVWGARSEVRP